MDRQLRTDFSGLYVCNTEAARVKIKQDSVNKCLVKMVCLCLEGMGGSSNKGVGLVQ